jgi:sporulation protein YlmC with PRC-barrel domain/ElaB/YqjD/DUF883 family membrane-anchored ribosome-binding protein
MRDIQTRLQQAAQQLQQADAATADQSKADARKALDDLQQALQGEGGQLAQDQADQMKQRIDQARQQLDTDPQQAAVTIQQLAQSTQQLQMAGQQAEIPPDADRIVGKKLMAAGKEAGEISDVLVTSDGKVAAVLVKAGGALGVGGKQVAIPWNEIKIQGDQVTVNLSADQIDAMPEYKVE